MASRLFLVSCLLLTCLFVNQVSSHKPNAHCSLQTCSAIVERVRNQEVRIHALETAFRRVVSALTAANRVLEGDSAIRTVVDEPTISQRPDDLNTLILPQESDGQSEETTEPSSNGRPLEVTEPVHAMAHLHVEESGNGKKNDLTATTEALRADLDRVNRQVTGLYDVIGQWEKGITEQNHTIMKIDQRLQEALTGPSTNFIERPNSEESTVDRSFISQSIDHLRGGVLCSLAHLVDFDYPDYFSLGRYLSGESPVYGTSSIEVILGQEGSLSIQWQLHSGKCDQFLTGAWIRVFEPSPQSNKSNAPFFKVPKDCLKRSAGTFTLALPSTTNSYDVCNYHLDLSECREHTVEVIPSYSGLRGKVLVTRFKSPPKMTSQSTALRTISFSASINALNLNWTVNSNDCDRQLDSVHVRIRDEKMGKMPASFTITNQCFSKTSTNPGARNYANPFTTSLAPNHRFDDCRYQWTRLDQCQKYRLELEPTYWSGSWNERTLHKFPAASMTVFTSETSPECCNRITAPSGALSSPPLRDRQNGSRDCFWWITVQPNHTIWLTITQLKIKKSDDYIQIFDGPDDSSPVLLSLSEDTKPSSVRSVSNEMFVKSSCSGPHRDFKAVYTSVINIRNDSLV